MPKTRPISFWSDLMPASSDHAENPMSSIPETAEAVFTIDARHHKKKNTQMPLLIQASELPVTLQSIQAHLDHFSTSPDRTLRLLDEVVGEKSVTEAEIVHIVNEESCATGGKVDKIEVMVYDLAVEEYGRQHGAPLGPENAAQGGGESSKHIPLQVLEPEEQGQESQTQEEQGAKSGGRFGGGCCIIL